MTKQLDEWCGEFGDEYTKRNMPDEQNIQQRMSFWSGILATIPHPPPNSLLEIGANVGGNLIAIDNIYKLHNMAVNLYAVEPNESARKILQQQNIRSLHMEIGCLGTMANLMLGRSKKDVVFTCGVLIHIPPDILDGALRDIYDMSNRYIICAEYFSPQEREIKYQGRDGLLWTRDYGSLFLDQFKGLRCVSFGFSWKRITGMDNLTWWVFEKVN